MIDLRRLPRWFWLALLAACAICLHALLLGGYPPILQPDSGTYVASARDLASGDFSVGQGRRTPGYPLLILLVGESPHSIVAAQMVLGVTIAWALFAITSMLTRSRLLAFIAGVSYLVNLQQLLQESVVMSETLSTWSVAVTMLALLKVLRNIRQERHVISSSALLGVLAGFAVLVRPQFVFFLPLLPLLLLYADKVRRWPTRQGLSAAVLVFASACAPVFGWAAVMHAKLGTFTLSTQSGFGLVNHAIDSIELVSDRYAPVRDVLLKTREDRIREVGHSRNTIWYAWPEIQRITGWTLPNASRELQHMCVALFVAYPGRYALSVAHAWIDFWTVPIFWSPEQIQPDGLRRGLKAVWWLEHIVLRLANLVFVLVALSAVVSRRARSMLQWEIGMTAIAVTVMMSSLTQALFDQGASSRYALPTQALVAVLLMICWARARSNAVVNGKLLQSVVNPTA